MKIKVLYGKTQGRGTNQMRINKKLPFLLAMLLLLAGCGQVQNTEQSQAEPMQQVVDEKTETIEGILSDLSIEEKVGQMLMMDFRKNPDDTGMTVLSEDVKKQIKQYHLGGVILFAENLDTAAQTKQLTSDMQKAAEIPLFIGIDEEGGIVSRLNKSQIPHEIIPEAAQMQGDVTQAAQAGKQIGIVLADLGINVDFAPVVDVYTNPENTVIGTRAYGTEPEVVSDMGAAFANALQDTGVQAVAKHFPGHGDTVADSHNGIAVSDHDLERLRAVEFPPFQRMIQEGIGFVMVGHITLPQITTDAMPATLSKEAIDLLRQELGFDGVIITDAMNMGAIVEYYPTGEAAVKAVQAGIDIILMPANLEEAYTALCQAVQNGTISESRLDESVRRILDRKYESGLL